MLRRMLVDELVVGVNALSREQRHHARDVLRMRAGEEVELFTASGRSARAVLREVSEAAVLAEVTQIVEAGTRFELTIASAIPKGARADWMIEKLSELGVSRFVPLMTARSVVHPEGKNKIERWERLAAESAKQSRRSGVMEISPLLTLEQALGQMDGLGGYLSTGADATTLSSILHLPSSTLALFTGPEGGWTAEEEALMRNRGLTPVTLGGTILRVETAAMAAAAVVAALRQ